MQLLVQVFGGRFISIDCKNGIQTEWIKEQLELKAGIPCNLQRLSTLSRDLHPCESLEASNGVFPILKLSLSVVGGKGGFGSLLRGQGAKAGAKKTTNFDSCRDLSGRRIRHVNQEKKLQDWYATEGERKAKEMEEKEKAREEKKLKELATQVHFDEVKYASEIRNIHDSINDAVEKGLKKAKLKNPTKRPKTLPIEDLLEEGEEKKSENPLQPGDSAPQKEENKKETTKEEEEDGNVDLENFKTAEQMEQLGLETLKNELKKRGLLCGGTLNQRAQRLFSAINSKIVDPKLLAKPSNKRKHP